MRMQLRTNVVVCFLLQAVNMSETLVGWAFTRSVIVFFPTIHPIIMVELSA